MTAMLFLLHGIPSPANGETPRANAVADSMSRFVTRQSRRQMSCRSARFSPLIDRWKKLRFRVTVPRAGNERSSRPADRRSN